MSNEKILDRIAKLLRLANNNPNPNESAAAASAAQKLLDEHNLTEAMLNINAVDNEPIYKTMFDKSKRVPRWKVHIAMTLQAYHNVRVYFSGREFFIIGRKNDIEMMKVFYEYLCGEVVMLTKLNAYGRGHTYSNNYSIGAAANICERIDSARAQWRRENVANSEALVRIDSKKKRVDAAAEKLGLRRRAGGMVKYNPNARELGYNDGNSIPINKMIR